MTLKNVRAYLQGNYRYRLYYSKFKFLIRKYIREQIDYRIGVMDLDCYKNGVCKMCGCMTTALQMANKRCDGDCYPPILNQIQWERYMHFKNVKADGIFWLRNIHTGFPQIRKDSKQYV